jgi:membrane-associated phospholipid phosphatase
VSIARFVEEGLLRAWRPEHTRLQRVAAAISEASRGGALWIALSAVLVPSRSLRRAGRDGLAAWALGSGLAFALKAGVNRRRPALPGRGPAPKSSSMPSSHTAGATAYAVAATAASPVIGLVVAPAALGVAWSRVAAQRHFPTDVAVGAGLGFAAGIAVALVARRARRPAPSPDAEVGSGP